VQALVDALGDKDGAVRRSAAEALGKLGDKAAVPALINRVADDVWIGSVFDHASDPHAGGKGAALEALKALDKERVPEALKAALKSQTVGVRMWAARELGGVKEKGVVDALLPALNDESGAVRRVAAISLGRLGDKSAVPALAKRVADDTWIASPFNDKSDPYGGGKGAALDALRKLDKDKVEEALLQATKSKNPKVKEWALEELGTPKDKK
jgi:HEAT repeat protein